jgi:hypothetical protein
MATNGIPNDFSYLDNEVLLWRNSGASASDSLASSPSTPLYSCMSPSSARITVYNSENFYKAQFNGFATPPSDSSGGLDYQQELASYHNNSPSSPFESLLGTPETIPSDARIMAHISHIRNEGVSNTDRPVVCVDTSLLFRGQSNYPDSATFSPPQNSSPGLLSPYLPSSETRFPEQPHLQRRHSHSRSTEDAQQFRIEKDFSMGVDGRGYGLHRVNSAPTSRQQTPYNRPNKLARTTNDSRSISPLEVGRASESADYQPSNDVAQASPSSTEYVGREVVATERIRAASTARRQNPPM